MANHTIGTRFDFDRHMLWGDNLRVLLNSHDISYGEINEILREKGIFIDSADKSITVPLLSSCLLTPTEFKKLISKSFSRESIKKYKYHNLPLKQEDVDWQSAILDDFDEWTQAVFLDQGQEFIEKPYPTINQSGEIEISYKVKKNDFSQDWIEQELIFDGHVLIKKSDNNLLLELDTTHTSKETDKINQRFINTLSNKCHQKGITQSAEANSIKFNDFTNEQRIAFFLQLTGNQSKHFKFEGFDDIDIVRDANAGPLPNDPEISWMEGRVRRIKMGGSRLDKIVFVTNKKYHKYYFFSKVSAQYKFTFGTNEGTCMISFSFPSKHTKGDDFSNSTLDISIEKLSKIEKASETNVRKKIKECLRELQNHAQKEALKK